MPRFRDTAGNYIDEEDVVNPLGGGAIAVLDSGPLVLPDDNGQLFTGDLPQGTWILAVKAVLRQDTGVWTTGFFELILTYPDGTNGGDLVRYDLENAYVQGVDGPYWMVEPGVVADVGADMFLNAPRAAYVLDAGGGSIQLSSFGDITHIDIRVIAVTVPPA